MHKVPLLSNAMTVVRYDKENAMKRINKPLLVLSAALLVSLTACGGSSSSASASASASASSAPASSAVSSAASTSEANTLTPQPTFTVSEESEYLTTRITPDGTIAVVATLDDGSYAASIQNGVTVTDEYDGNTTTLHGCALQLYTYDLYDAAAVDALQVGDTITTHTGDGEETRDVTVEKLEASDGFVTINGGVEEGGMYLVSEGGAYRTLTMDDYPVFYPVGGTVSLALAPDVTLSDSSAEYGAEPVVTSGAEAVAQAIAGDTVGFSCYNTSVTVKDGQIVAITRAWVP